MLLYLKETREPSWTEIHRSTRNDIWLFRINEIWKRHRRQNQIENHYHVSCESEDQRQSFLHSVTAIKAKRRTPFVDYLSIA